MIRTTASHRHCPVSAQIDAHLDAVDRDDRRQARIDALVANWLNDPALALSLSMLVHIWKSLPFWTLILLAGRLAIPGELYEAASVDGAGAWHRFRYITWPSVSTLYVTCTLLSMIFTVGDFNSVYLLTGGGPADLTHVLATLGVRYLRLDQLELALTSIVVTMPFVLPLVFVMMKRLSK